MGQAERGLAGTDACSAGRWPLAAGRWPLAHHTANRAARVKRRFAGKRRRRPRPGRFRHPVRSGGRHIPKNSQHRFPPCGWSRHPGRARVGVLLAARSLTRVPPAGSTPRRRKLRTSGGLPRQWRKSALAAAMPPADTFLHSDEMRRGHRAPCRVRWRARRSCLLDGPRQTRAYCQRGLLAASCLGTL